MGIKGFKRFAAKFSSPTYFISLILITSGFFFSSSPLWWLYQLVCQLFVVILGLFFQPWRFVALICAILIFWSNLATFRSVGNRDVTCDNANYSMTGKVQQSIYQKRKKLNLLDVHLQCNKEVIQISAAQLLLDSEILKSWYLSGDRILITNVTVHSTDLFLFTFKTLKNTKIYNISSQEKGMERSSLLLYVQNKARYYLHSMPNLLFRSIMTADKTLMSKSWKKNISNLGIAHLFAISGLHVGIIYLWLSFLFRLILYLPKRILVLGYQNYFIDLLAVVLIIFFLQIIGTPISALRSAMMLSWWLFMRFFLPNQSNWFILSGVAIIILLFEPHAIGTLSFQLSFLSVSGILLILPILPVIRKKDKIKIKLIKSLVLSMSISGWITLLTLPIIQSISTQYSIFSVFFNWFHILFVSWIFLPISIVTFGITVFSYPFWGFYGEFYLFSILNLTGNVWNLMLTQSIYLNKWGLFDFKFDWTIYNTIFYWSFLTISVLQISRLKKKATAHHI